MKRTTIRLIAGLAISAFFLYLALHRLDLRETIGYLVQARYGCLIPATMIYMAGIAVRALRWGVLLKPVGRMRYKTVFSVLTIGYMANNLLPLRLGEFYRAYCLEQREGIRKSSSLGTIVVERIFDGLTMLVFLVGASLLLILPSWGRGLLVGSAVLFIGSLAMVFILAVKRTTAVKIAGWMMKRLPTSLRARGEGIVSAFVDGFGAVLRGRALGITAVLSLLSWSLEAGSYMVLAPAFGVLLPWWTFWFLLAVINLGIMIPASPGYVGTFEFFGIRALELLGIAHSMAAGYVVVLHLLIFFPITILGLILVWTFNLKLAVDPGEKAVADD